MADAAALGTILGVWAHPDDETYLSGALMAKAVDDGRRVVCVTATKGEEGFAADDPRDVGERMEVRSAEAAASLRVLGVAEHHWLGYADGGCAVVDDAGPVAELTALIEQIRPDTVLTFGPEGMTGHSDHMAVSRWATVAVRTARHPCRLLYATKTLEWNEQFRRHIDPRSIMMIEGMEPPAVPPADLAVCYRPTDPILDRKVDALRAQASQTTGLREILGEVLFRQWVADEFFRAARADDWVTTHPVT